MKRSRHDNDISFLGRVFLFFRGLKEKIASWHLWKRLTSSRKAIAGYEDADSPREAKLSYHFDMLRLFATVLLCLFVFFSLIFASGIISYENVYYMFKDIGYINSFSESHPNTLNYSKPFKNQAFASFKSGLAVAGDSEIKFFTSAGRMTLTQGSPYTNPGISTSGSHAMVYDRGGKSFSIYNSFIEVYSGTESGVISSAYMSRSGVFCIVTTDGSHGSAVYIYDADFSLLSKYSKNDYVIGAALSENGKFLAVLSLDAQNGESMISMNVLRVGDNELYSETRLYGSMPYALDFTSSDRIAVICDESSLIYDLKGKVKSEYEYPDKLTHFSIADGGYALGFSSDRSGGAELLASFDENGGLKQFSQIDGHIKDLVMYDDYAYLLLGDKVLRVDLVGGFVSETAFSEEEATLLVLENGELLACTPGSAYYISFGIVN